MDLRSAHKKPQTQLHLSLTSEDEDPTYSACERTRRTLRSRSSQKLCLDSSPEDWDDQREESDEEDDDDDDNDRDYEDNEEEEDDEEEEEDFLKEATRKTGGGDGKWKKSWIKKVI